MMNLKIEGAITGLSVVSVGALAGVAVAQNAGKFVATKAETVQTTRRIWVVNADNWWVKDVQAHAFGSVEQYVTVNWIYDTFYKGLGYADIDSANTTIQFKPVSSWDNRTANITLDPQIDSLDDDPDVYWLYNGTTKDGTVDARNYGTNTATLGEDELSTVLSHIDTCGTSYACGYNAYPQLMVNFWNAPETKPKPRPSRPSITKRSASMDPTP